MKEPNPYQMGFDFTEAEPDYRLLREISETYTVRSPVDAAIYLRREVFNPFEQFTQEEMWCLMFNTRMRLTHDYMVYRGTINTMNVRIAEIFRPAILCASAYIMLSHCHPSGDPAPSPEDVRSTQEIVNAGELLGVRVLDHLIVGNDSWVSLKEKGLGFS